MFAPNSKPKEASSRFYPKLESLEDRLPFAADLAIDFDLGETLPGLDAPEIVIVGGAASIESADATSLEDGGHLFVYSEEFPNYTEIFGRLTNPDGTPGDAPMLLKAITTNSNTAAPEVMFATTSLENGGFALVWSSDSGVYAQLFDEQLIASSQEIQVAQGSSANAAVFSLDILQRLNGNIVIAYSDPSSEQMTVREYPSDLVGVPNQWQDNNVPNQNETPPVHAKLQELPNTGVRLSWTTNDTQAPQNWAIYSVDVDSGATSGARWDLYNFASMPQVAYQTDGDIILTGVEQLTTGSYQTVVRLLDPNQAVISETILSTNFTVLGDLHGLTVLDDDSYAVSGFLGTTAAEGLFVQAFNASGDTIGEPELLNDADANSQLHSGIFGLDTGGLAAYWLGYALDGNSTAVFSRTVQLESTEVLIEITDLNSVINQAADYVIIEGVPDTAGLNKGTQLSATSWEVPVNDLDDLYILNFQHRDSMSLEVSLVESASNQVLASEAPGFGSELDDFIPITSIDDLIDGRDGVDTVFISDYSSNFSFEPKSEDEFRLESNDAIYDLLLRDVEFVAFYDETFELGDSDADDVEELEPPESEFEDDDDSVPWLYDDYFVEAFDEYEMEYLEFEFADDLWMPLPGDGFRIPAEPGGRGDRFYESDFDSDEHISEFAESDELEDLLLIAKPRPEPESSANALEVDGESPPEVANLPTALPLETGSPEAIEELANAFPIEVQEPQLSVTETLNAQLGSDLNAGQAIIQNAAPVQRLDDAYTSQIVSVPANGATEEIVTAQATSVEPITEYVGLETPVDQTEFENELFTVAPAFDAEMLFDNLDEVIEEAKSDQVVAEVVVGSAVVVATGVSIANVAWLLRGSVLFTKLLSSMPIWISFDPLPLLREVQQIPVNGIPNESLVDIVSSGNE